MNLPLFSARSEGCPTAVIHLRIPKDQIQHQMGPAIQELMETLAAQHTAPAGPLFSYHADAGPDHFDFEVGVPVTAPVTPAGRVQNSSFPQVPVLRTIY